MPLPGVIDIEASGFGRGSHPIEIGVALSDGRTMCRLVRPVAGWTHDDAWLATLCEVAGCIPSFRFQRAFASLAGPAPSPTSS